MKEEKNIDPKLVDKIVAELVAVNDDFGLSVELTEEELDLARDFAKKCEELNAASESHNEKLKVQLGQRYVQDYLEREIAFGKLHRREIVKRLGPVEVDRLLTLIEEVGGARNLPEVDRLKWRGAGLDLPDKPDGMGTRWKLATQQRRPMPSSWNKPKPMARASGKIGDGPRPPRDDFFVALARELNKGPLFMKDATVEQLEARIKELRNKEMQEAIVVLEKKVSKVADLLQEVSQELESLKK